MNVRAMTVRELFDYATDETKPHPYRVKAQDELSRRAFYEGDAEASKALSQQGLNEEQT